VLDLLKFDIGAANRTRGAFRDIKSDLGGIKGALAGVQDYARRGGRAMRNMGAVMSAGVTTPLVLLGKQSVSLYDTQLRAQKTVEQALVSTAGAVGKTKQELFGMASALQGLTTFGDEDILQNVTAPLLTFTKIQGDVFERAQGSVLDMATLLKMDLKSASILVGKALNDPIKGVAALGRSGVQFSDDQKKVIKSLVETGQTAKAQALILQELETQFGGQAAAAAEAPLGKLRQLQNAIGDVKEQLGEQIVPFLVPLVEKVQVAVDWFSALDPAIKKNIVVVGGLAAAAGPLLLVLGGITLAMGALLSPIGAVVVGFALVAGAVGYVVAKWDELKRRFPILDKAANFGSRIADAWSNLPSIKWALLIPVLRWARFIPGLSWLAFVPTLKWASLAGALRWSSLITPLVWGLRFIPVVGWASLAGMLAWNLLIKPLGWDTYIEKIDWAKYIPEINWDNIFKGANTGTRYRAIGRKVGADLTEGLSEGIAATAASPGSAARAAMKSTVNSAKAEAGIQSPSKVFADIGRQLMAGLAIGIGESGKGAEAAMSAATKNIIEHGSGALGFVGGVKQGITQMLSQTLSGAQTWRQAMTGVLSGFSNQLFSSASSAIVNAILPFARGGVIAGGMVQPFADGGIVSQPTYFPMRNGAGLMGEAGPEAIMPLTRRGGKLGVRAEVPQRAAAESGRLDVYVHPSGEFDARVEGIVGNIYDAREAGTVQKSISGVYAANQKRPLI